MSESVNRQGAPAGAAQVPPRPPAPKLHDLLDDVKWFDSELKARNYFEEYRGQHVAVVGRRVVGSDTDPARLRDRVAEELHVHPERVVITYIGNWDEFLL